MLDSNTWSPSRKVGLVLAATPLALPSDVHTPLSGDGHIDVLSHETLA